MSIEMAPNISSEISPFKQALLSTACWYFNLGSNDSYTYIPNPTEESTDSEVNWTALFLKYLTINIVTMVTFAFLVPNKASRTATLLGLAGSCISSFYISGYFLMAAYAAVIGLPKTDFLVSCYSSNTVNKEFLQVHLCCQWPVFLHMNIISKILKNRSTIKFPLSGRTCFYAPLLITVVLTTMLRLFPIPFECTATNLYYTAAAWIFALLSLTDTINDSYCFVKIFNAERLYIEEEGKIVGCLINGKSGWIKAQVEHQD